jgi:hypothetical protein
MPAEHPQRQEATIIAQTTQAARLHARTTHLPRAKCRKAFAHVETPEKTPV